MNTTVNERRCSRILNKLFGKEMDCNDYRNTIIRLLTKYKLMMIDYESLRKSK